MKITKNTLKELIKEELQKILLEDDSKSLKAKSYAAGKKAYMDIDHEFAHGDASASEESQKYWTEFEGGAYLDDWWDGYEQGQVDREYDRYNDPSDRAREREEAEREDGQWPGPSFNDKEEAVRVMAEELVEAIRQMGNSNPELTDYYIMIMRALRDAGVRIEALVQMS